MIISKTNRSDVNKVRSASRSLLLDVLEPRTLFSVAMLPPELFAEATGGPNATQLNPQHERLAPPENNHEASMSATQPDNDVMESSHRPELDNRGPQMGDLDANGTIDQSDIDAMQAAIRGGRYSVDADLNGDHVVDEADRDMLVRDILDTEYGDVNLDGRVNRADWEVILKTQYVPGVNGWRTGDLNGDGLSTPADWRIWNQYKDVPRTVQPPTHDEIPELESPAVTVTEKTYLDPEEQPIEPNSLGAEEVADLVESSESILTIRPTDRSTESGTAESPTTDTQFAINQQQVAEWMSLRPAEEASKLDDEKLMPKWTLPVKMVVTTPIEVTSTMSIVLPIRFGEGNWNRL